MKALALFALALSVNAFATEASGLPNERLASIQEAVAKLQSAATKDEYHHAVVELNANNCYVIDLKSMNLGFNLQYAIECVKDDQK